MTILTALVLLSFALVMLIGGKTGFNSLSSVMINGILLVLVALLISWGINILVLTLIFIPLKLAAIIFSGTHDVIVVKNPFYAAILVTTATILIIICLQYFAQAAGLGDETGEELVGLSPYPGLSYPETATTVTIFSILGAISEASVVMSSDILELKKYDSEITRIQFEKSGANIGKDVSGTSVDTTLFGLFGSFLPLFIWYMRLNYPLGKILNDKLFVNEVSIMVYSIIGVALTIPSTSYLLAKKVSKEKA